MRFKLALILFLFLHNAFAGEFVLRQPGHQPGSSNDEFSVEILPAYNDEEYFSDEICDDISRYHVKGTVKDKTLRETLEFLFHNTPFKYELRTDFRFLVSANFDNRLNEAVNILARETRLKASIDGCNVIFTPKD